MRPLMPWVVAVAIITAFLVWFVVVDVNRADDQFISDAELAAAERTGEVRDPWWQERPALTGVGAGLLVLVVGSLVVIAINSERR